MKRVSTIINFFLLILLFWVVVLFIADSELLAGETLLFSLANSAANVFIYPQFLLDANENRSAFNYFSLVYLILFFIYLNIFVLYFFESARSSDPSFNLPYPYTFSSVIAALVYSKVQPPIYSHPNPSGHGIRSLSKTKIQELVEELAKDDKTKMYFLVMLILGYILFPFFCMDLLGAKPNRLIAFWNLALMMIYLQFKFSFEAVFVVVFLFDKKQSK